MLPDGSPGRSFVNKGRPDVCPTGSEGEPVGLFYGSGTAYQRCQGMKRECKRMPQRCVADAPKVFRLRGGLRVLVRHRLIIEAYDGRRLIFANNCNLPM
ncbi:hypothetical protein VTN96DRAFT_10423 [Rasamsonia emersonii]